jgi:hypothetical protein
VLDEEAYTLTGKWRVCQVSINRHAIILENKFKFSKYSEMTTTLGPKIQER